MKFVIVLFIYSDSKVSIINDQLFITMVSKQQADMCRSLVKKAMMSDAPAAPFAASAVPSTSIAAGISSLPNGNPVMNAEQQEMLIVSLSRETGMKRSWSKKYVKIYKNIRLI